MCLVEHFQQCGQNCLNEHILVHLKYTRILILKFMFVAYHESPAKADTGAVPEVSSSSVLI